MFAGEPGSCAPHPLTQQRLRSGAVGSPRKMSRASVAWWLSQVFAHLWKRGGENYSAKASRICTQSGGQRKRRCFCELQVSALPRAESRAAVSSVCPLSCLRVTLVSATFSGYGFFCANYTKNIERMSLSLQRTQSRLALTTK